MHSKLCLLQHCLSIRKHWKLWVERKSKLHDNYSYVGKRARLGCPYAHTWPYKANSSMRLFANLFFFIEIKSIIIHFFYQNNIIIIHTSWKLLHLSSHWTISISTRNYSQAIAVFDTSVTTDNTVKSKEILYLSISNRCHNLTYLAYKFTVVTVLILQQ